MRKAVKRYYGARHWRYITCSCFQRRAGLGRARAGGLFLRIVDEVPAATAWWWWPAWSGPSTFTC